VRGEAFGYRLTAENGLTITSRSAGHWSQQSSWLNRLYPRELSWHLPVNWKALEPGFSGKLYRLMNLTFPCHWAVQREGVLLGVLTWQRSFGNTDHLWLATPEIMQEDAVRELLTCTRRRLSSRRLARLNYPAAQSEDAFRSAGYEAVQTLLWMEYRLGG